MNKIKISKSTVDKIPLPEKGQVDYYDLELKSFGVRASKTGKTYFVFRRVKGESGKTYVIVGKHGEDTAEQARLEASVKIVNMKKGINPNKEWQDKKASTVTLQELFDQYLKARKDLKPGTIYNYEKWMKNYFPDWLNKCIADVDSTMIAKRHVKIGTDNGKAQANNALRLLRALFSYGSIIHKKLVPQNPVDVLSKTRSWYRIERRRSIIKNHDLPAWFKAVKEMESRRGRDYLLLVLFTGMRRREATRLQWSDIDFNAKAFTVQDTKNKEPLTLPLSNFIYNLLKQRKEDTYESEYVFPGRGKADRLENVRWFNLKIKEKTGIQFSTHDLRRVFETTAEACDIPHYSLKALLNHSIDSDVTAGYIVRNVERLRRPMQKVTNAILKAAEPTKAKIIQMNRAA